jgi:hypothetical protein
MSNNIKQLSESNTGLKDSSHLYTIETKFILDFISFWEGFKQFLSQIDRSSISWEDRQKICEDNLHTVTREFYEKWKHTKLLQWGVYIKKYSSFTLKVRGGIIILPYRILLYESHYPGNNSLDALKKEPTEFRYEKAIFDLKQDLNIELKEAEFRIIRKIANPQFTKSLDKFPTVKELTYSLRYKDERTINKGLQFLICNSILGFIYLTDVSKIGYATDVIFHQKKLREIPTEILAYMVISFPLSYGKDCISVIQYPNTCISKLEEIKSTLEVTGNISLTKQQQGWNLEGLTKKRLNRWQLLPPALTGRGFTAKIIPALNSAEYNLESYFDPFQLNLLDARLLGIISGKSTMSVNTLMRELGVGREYITEAWKTLLQNQIISRFPLFSNVGLGGWVNFAIKGDNDKHNAICTNILRHLQFFPYRNIFSNIEESLLMGVVNMPITWLRTFLYQLAELPHYYEDLEYFYYIGPEVYGTWGLDILKTYDWGSMDK